MENLVVVSRQDVIPHHLEWREAIDDHRVKLVELTKSSFEPLEVIKTGLRLSSKDGAIDRLGDKPVTIEDQLLKTLADVVVNPGLQINHGFGILGDYSRGYLQAELSFQVVDQSSLAGTVGTLYDDH